MIHKSTTRAIKGSSPEAVLDLLADITTVDRWNTHVKKVELASTKKQGLGASRVCHFHDGTSLKETVTEMDDSHIKMEVSEFSLPLNEMSIEFTVSPSTRYADGTDLTFSAHYNVKYGPIGYLLGVTVLKMKLHDVQTKILAGIDHHLATGERIGKDFDFSKQ